MLVVVGDVFIGLAIAGAALGGGALYWIARQDGSPQGRVVGTLIVLAAVVAGLYLTLGFY
jgi:hypothetical protein